MNKQWWTARLLPICDALVQSAAGRPPLAFWRAIYKPQDIYGGHAITGWLADLFPYLQSNNGQPPCSNPIFSRPRAELTVEQGISPEALPNGLNRAPFTLASPLGTVAMDLVAGFIGVAQDSQGRLAAEIGWGVCEQDGMARITEQILSGREHRVSSPHPNEPFTSVEIPAALVQLNERCNGVTLFADTPHPWRIRRSVSYESCAENADGDRPVIFIDLPDGRAIAYCIHQWSTVDPDSADQAPPAHDRDERYLLFEDPPGTRWHEEVRVMVGRSPGSFQFQPEPPGLIAVGIQAFFEHIFAAEGRYFFDMPERGRTGSRLLERVRRRSGGAA